MLHLSNLGDKVACGGISDGLGPYRESGVARDLDRSGINRLNTRAADPALRTH
jgi:hypothetical protein